RHPTRVTHLPYTSLFRSSVEAAAARLRQEGTLEALRDYKEALREAIAAALARTYAVQAETGFARGGRRRLLYVVRVLDAKLEEQIGRASCRERGYIRVAA